MGKKKGKKPSKTCGSEKTAAKTEKKMEKKTKKMLQNIEEEDVEALIAEFKRNDELKMKVCEEKSAQPSPRSNMSLTAHPDKDYLIMFGGEYFNGTKTFMYNDLYLYDISSDTWIKITAPKGPPPRSSHQAVAVAQMGGQLWIFGGEFASPTQSQFYHYKDLWVFGLKERKWEKISASGGPSARSGHRMVVCKKLLFVFGGFHDNNRECKYFNDLYAFNLDDRIWIKLDITGSPPAPRSGCLMTSNSHHQLLIYGGYSRLTVKRDVEKGCTHTDMFLLTSDSKSKDAAIPTKWKWTSVKQSGDRPSPRSGCSLAAVSASRAFVFGGVFDEEEDEESVKGVCYNDMYYLDTDQGRWYQTELRTKNLTEDRKKKNRDKRKTAADGVDMEETSDKDEQMDVTETTDESLKNSLQQLIVDEQQLADTNTTTFDDGIFTVTIGPAPATDSQQSSTVKGSGLKKFMPSCRMNASVAVKHSTLYLYGGMYEDGDRQLTLSDFYSIDLKKMDDWRIIVPQESTVMEWQDSASESSSSNSDDDDDDNDDDDDDNRDECAGGVAEDNLHERTRESGETHAEAPVPVRSETVDQYTGRTLEYWLERARVMSEQNEILATVEQRQEAANRLAEEHYEKQRITRH